MNCDGTICALMIVIIFIFCVMAFGDSSSPNQKNFCGVLGKIKNVNIYIFSIKWL